MSPLIVVDTGRDQASEQSLEDNKMKRENESENDHFCKSKGRVQF